MYILSDSLKIIKNKFVKKTLSPDELSPVMITLAGCVGYKNFSNSLLLNKVLINVYTMKPI